MLERDEVRMDTLAVVQMQLGRRHSISNDVEAAWTMVPSISIRWAPLQPGSQRRVHDAEFKVKVPAGCQQPGTSAAALAMAHGLIASITSAGSATRDCARSECSWYSGTAQCRQRQRPCWHSRLEALGKPPATKPGRPRGE